MLVNNDYLSKNIQHHEVNLSTLGLQNIISFGEGSRRSFVSTNKICLNQNIRSDTSCPCGMDCQPGDYRQPC